MSTSEHILLALETENKYGNGFISNMKFRNNWKNNNNMQIERLYKNNPYFFLSFLVKALNIMKALQRFRDSEQDTEVWRGLIRAISKATEDESSH